MSVRMTTDEPDEIALTAAGLVPHDDGTWRDEHDEVAAASTPLGLFVGWVDFVWFGPASPKVQLKGVVHVARGGNGQLTAVLRRVRRRREAALRTCRYCGGRHVPGHMHAADECQACAERLHGVVH